MDRIAILGVQIDNIDMDDAIGVLKGYLDGDRLNVIYTPNTEMVMRAKDDKCIRDIINSGDLISPDGIGLIYASRIGKKPLKERITGIDLSTILLEIGNERGSSLFLLGGREGVAERAGRNIMEAYPNISLVGHHHGYFKGSHRGIYGSDEERILIQDINRLKPHIIFVGLGFPGQEIWIHRNRARLLSKVVIGNGGTLDILAGDVRRAPEVFQRLGLEWFYRLVKEPSRIRRQMALPKFMLSVLFNRDAVD